jgi:hypothetical protein
MSKRIIITLSICLAFVLSSNAQSQLTFNQVLLIPLTSQGDTVPQGKVWKVESAVSEMKSTSQHIYFYINNNKCTVTRTWVSLLANAPYALPIVNPIFPMWLPAGSIVKSGTDVEALSIIEFNIE